MKTGIKTGINLEKNHHQLEKNLKLHHILAIF